MLESHPSLAAAAHKVITALLSAAAGAIRQGLDANPGSAELWGALGSVCRTPAQQEYALCRSLQLERGAAWVWVALGRLYVANGDAALADACFEQARCANAATGSVWAGMGVAALALHRGMLCGVGWLQHTPSASRSKPPCIGVAMDGNGLCHNDTSYPHPTDVTAARCMLHQATNLGAAAEPLANWAALALKARAALLQQGPQEPAAAADQVPIEEDAALTNGQQPGGETSDSELAEVWC